MLPDPHYRHYRSSSDDDEEDEKEIELLGLGLIPEVAYGF